MWESESFNGLGLVSSNFLVVLAVMVVVAGAFASSAYNAGVSVPVTTADFAADPGRALRETQAQGLGRL